VILCGKNTCPIINNASTEDDDFLQKFFKNALVVDLNNLDIRNNKDVNDCAILEKNITQRIKILSSPYDTDDDERWVNLGINHFNYEYFDNIYKNDVIMDIQTRENLVTQNINLYNVSSSSNMINDNFIDSESVNSDITMYDNEFTVLSNNRIRNSNNREIDTEILYDNLGLNR
jgi:hypothetical protein